MKKTIAFIGAFFVTTLVPVVAMAQQTAAQACSSTSYYPSDVSGIICSIYRIVNVAIPVMIVLAIAYFIFGVLKFIGGGEEAREKGQHVMIQGVIGFAVILGLWGLVRILLSTFGLTGSNSTLPGTLPTF